MLRSPGGASDQAILGSDSSDTQVLFNDGGIIAGDAGMTFSKAGDTLSLGSGLIAGVSAVVTGSTFIGSGLVRTASGGQFSFSSAADNSASADAGFSRAAAGYIELNQGTAGTLDALVSSSVFAVTQAVTALSNSSTSPQNVFAAANDVLTLRATTTYFFEAQIFLNTGITTHTTAIGFPASSAFTGINYLAELWSTTSQTISTTAPSMLDVNVSTAVVLNATSVAPRTTIRCKGVIRTNASTTVTPQITFNAGPGTTCEVAVNSFFRAWPVGTNTVAAFGDWA